MEANFSLLGGNIGHSVISHEDAKKKSKSTRWFIENLREYAKLNIKLQKLSGRTYTTLSEYTYPNKSSNADNHKVDFERQTIIIRALVDIERNELIMVLSSTDNFGDTYGYLFYTVYGFLFSSLNLQ